MFTLLIEHPVTDFDVWQNAFARFAAQRKQGGVLSERVLQPVGDAHYVFIDLDFATLDAAQRFQQFLETQVWSNPANSPALDGTPRCRLASHSLARA